MKRTAVYAGTFDPITHGHIDIIKRAMKIFDRVIVAVSESKHKKPFFTLDERVEMAKDAVKGFKGVSVDLYRGLLVDYMKKVNAKTVIRGLRAVQDFEYEFQLALINKKLSKNIELIYMMPEADFLYISSSSVKEIASHGKSVKTLATPLVERKLRQKMGY